jgi:tRNA(fMet)-specific endonuclease VapC
MPVYMLDTDISSYIMKRSHDAVLKRLQAVPIADIAISAITKSELMYGVEVSPRKQHDRAALEAYLKHVEVLDYSEGAALHYGQIRAVLKGAGTMIGANDLLIAAHARSLSLILVTNNTREFSRVDGLRLENWTLPLRSRTRGA